MEIKAILKSIWQGLPCNLQKRVSFHTFVYTKADEVKYSSLRYAEGLPLKLERKMGYVSFVRFVQGCDVVINLTTGSILGRITFLSAALGKPGVFSDNAEINRALYPNSCIAMSDKANLRTQLWRLLLSGLERQVDDSFHPLASAVEDIGDYSANTARMRALITG
jgi:hypothetical protein